MAAWVEELREDNFKICLREAKIFDGLHSNIKIVSEFHLIFFFESVNQIAQDYVLHANQKNSRVIQVVCDVFFFLFFFYNYKGYFYK